MQYFYPLLVYTGLTGILLLLGIELIPNLKAWHKPMTAAWLSFLTLIWLFLPQDGQWVLSVWLPSSVLGGQILLAMSPDIWLLGLVLGLVLSGIGWVEAVEARPALPLSGALVLFALMTTWLSIAGGSLLTVLAAWAAFDLFWGVARLLSGGVGERATFGLALHGVASLLLWVVSLLLERGGISALWWLMWPTPAILALLSGAALLRIGVYPFQIILPRRLGSFGTLTMVSAIGPVLGIGLLARILKLPGVEGVPAWVAIPGAVSLLFLAVRAWCEQGWRALFWCSYAMLGGIVTGATAMGASALVLPAMTAWLAGWTLIFLSRGHDSHAIFWSWPGWVAVICLLGAPPSPLGGLYRASLTAVPWIWRLVLVVGWAFMGAGMLRELHLRSQAQITPAWSWQQAALFIGFVMPLGGLLWALSMGGLAPFSWLGILLWLIALAAACALVWKGDSVAAWLQGIRPVVDLLDLAWLYRALWQGLEHLLSIVRIVSAVVEGRGALLWSLLALLIALLVVVNQ